jgi:hypothetical protein
MNGTWLLDVKKNKKGELYVELPYALLHTLKWKIGDKITWEQAEENHDSWLLKKIPSKAKKRPSWVARP